ncbi:unnamed protein product [Angiostrongylus costaricensis]|uniref:SWIB domain-containing protein n=1 Tax=Angiostrongylus costaricensis TaxID=334426 RepID=A0A0R3PIH2_ANGCS|nr:unnamed protein product [Angiostrongylus costaricensis]
MARKEVAKGEELTPLLKNVRKEEEKVAGEPKQARPAVRSQSTAKLKPVKETKQSPRLLSAPSQSTQSLSLNGKELYRPEQIKVLRLDEIMEDSNSQSSSKAKIIAPKEKVRKEVYAADNVAQKAILDQVCYYLKFSGLKKQQIHGLLTVNQKKFIIYLK